MPDPTTVPDPNGVPDPNAEMRRRWDERGAQYLANDVIFSRVSMPVADAIIAALGPLAGRSVLDIGCGAGGLSRMVSDLGATSVGVDISTTMINGARANHPDLRFVLADAQTADLGALRPGGFDHVVSKFGVMFFGDHRAAFANIRGACAPGGRLTFVCWRTLAENLMFRLGVDVLLSRMDQPPTPLCPGPDALADPDHLRSVLADAGWTDIDISALDTDLCYGVNGGDGVEERLAIALSGSNGVAAERELRPRLGERGWAEVLEEVRAEIRGQIIDGRVRFPGRTWLTRAVNPAA